MKKFWQWMKKNGYAVKDIYYGEWCLSDEPNSEGYFSPKKQMVIGYMIEYLIEKKKDNIYFFDISGRDYTIQGIYDFFKNEIEKDNK